MTSLINYSLTQQIPQEIFNGLESSFGPNGKSRFEIFLEAYYEWMAKEKNTEYTIQNLLAYKDIDKTLDEYLSYFQNGILSGVTPNEDVNFRQVLKNIKDFFLSKGTPNSFKFFFKLLYNIDCEIENFNYLRISDNIGESKQTIKLSGKESEISFEDMFKFSGKMIVGIDTNNSVYLGKCVSFSLSGNYIFEYEVLDKNFDDNTFLPNEQIIAIDPNYRFLTITTTLPSISVGMNILGKLSGATGTVVSVETNGDEYIVDILLTGNKIYYTDEEIGIQLQTVVSESVLNGKIIKIDPSFLKNSEYVEISPTVVPVISQIIVPENVKLSIGAAGDDNISTLSTTNVETIDIFGGMGYGVGENVIINDTGAFGGSGVVQKILSGPIENVFPANGISTGVGYLSFPTIAYAFYSNTISNNIANDSVTQAESNFTGIVHYVDNISNIIYVIPDNNVLPNTNNLQITPYSFDVNSVKKMVLGDTVIAISIIFVLDYISDEFEIGETFHLKDDDSIKGVVEYKSENLIWVSTAKESSFSIGDQIIFETSLAKATISNIRGKNNFGFSGAISEVGDNGEIKRIKVISGGLYDTFPYLKVNSLTGANASLLAVGSKIGSISNIKLNTKKMGERTGSGANYTNNATVTFNSKQYMFDKRIEGFQNDSILSVFKTSLGVSTNCIEINPDYFENPSENEANVTFANVQILAVMPSDYKARGYVTIGCKTLYPFETLDNNVLNDPDFAIQDNFRFQPYSYFIRVRKEYEHWSNIIKKYIHPAGSEMFSGFISQSTQINTMNVSYSTEVSYV